MTTIRTLTSEELSHRFWECGRARAKAEANAFSLGENRKRLLDVLTLQIIDNDPGTSHAKASSRARASDEFKTHIEGQTASVEARFIAMADYHECDFEIRRRLNLSFAKNQEMKAGRLVT